MSYNVQNHLTSKISEGDDLTRVDLINQQKHYIGLNQATSFEMNLQNDAETEHEEQHQATKDWAYDFRESNWRWLFLMVSCLSNFGPYYCLEIPNVLELVIEKKFEITQTQWSFLDSSYSYPNIILPFFAGLFIDKIGMRIGLVVFSLCLLMGQLINVIGAYVGSYPTLLLGTLMFGLGSECCIVAQHSILTVWFRDRNFAFVMAINLTFSKLGSALNSLVSPNIAENHGLGGVYLFGFGVLCVSVLANFTMGIMDLKAEQIEKKNRREIAQLVSAEEDEVVEDSRKKEKQIVTCKHVSKLRCVFWLLSFSCALTYMTIFPYLQTVTKILQLKYQFTNQRAGAMQGIPWYFSAFFAPFLGQIVDKIGRRGLLIIISSIILMVAHFTSMQLTGCQQCYDEVAPLIMLSIGYSIYASTMWASIAFTVPDEVLGTAYGVVECVQQSGLSVAPLIVAQIHDHTEYIGYGFYWVSAFYVALNIIGLILAVNLYRLDFKVNGGRLNMIHHKKKNEGNPLNDVDNDEDDHYQAQDIQLGMTTSIQKTSRVDLCQQFKDLPSNQQPLLERS